MPEKADKPLREKLKGRESQELVLAFSGAVGAGIHDVTPLFREELKNLNYRIVDIKVSALIREHASRLLTLRGVKHDYNDLGSVTGINRYRRYQDAGNQLREHFGNDVLGQLVVSKIAVDESRQPADSKSVAKSTSRVAFFIDSLKHQDEVSFLRQIYGNNFYLVGVLSAEQHRGERLTQETKAQAAEVKALIDRDRKENIAHGQQLDKALKLSDFFVRNSAGNKNSLESQVRRFCRLMHGAVDVTPTPDEFGMYVAYSSGLASACMSRQVGAAILDAEGTVLSTGCNDVPKAGGGLYSAGARDHRCVMMTGAFCHNDAEKDEIRREIQGILEEAKIPKADAERIALQIKQDTRLGDLIEFSRAVHAEMDALIALCRKGGSPVQGATLFTTTYPCHNCARHILAAGVSRVLYIEPYEKSLAVKLHSDAIVHDSEPEGGAKTKIPFLHFEGVAPRRYQELFLFASRKGDGGKKIQQDLTTAAKKTPQMLDSYLDIELKVVEALVENKLIERAADRSTAPQA